MISYMMVCRNLQNELLTGGVSRFSTFCGHVYFSLTVSLVMVLARHLSED